MLIIPNHQTSIFLQTFISDTNVLSLTLTYVSVRLLSLLFRDVFIPFKVIGLGGFRPIPPFTVNIDECCQLVKYPAQHSAHFVSWQIFHSYYGSGDNSQNVPSSEKQKI
uniref:Ovule protein n=1 Tax=Caenorhabditis tropicalis TaxID=1561998 RepID=A0A1I7TA45_9PELO